eukprot:TRINITY_DN486_c0_g2_i2.p1 TRINITY_DN486_c0_g2~~TRINITY_DN486_c0_g2_i2.p1  ORF type:complete len:1037 (+),score=295.54 TRINITY_DN486_c0_g2_i2:77-3187(+)
MWLCCCSPRERGTGGGRELHDCALGVETDTGEQSADSPAEELPRVVCERPLKGMSVGVPRETHPGERRVAVTPADCREAILAGFAVYVEAGAGADAGFSDADYARCGVHIVPTPDAAARCDVVLKVRCPQWNAALGRHEGELLSPASVLMCCLEPERNGDILQRLEQHRITAFALERVPDTPEGHPYAAVSSQAEVAGYKAVVEAASHLSRPLSGGTVLVVGTGAVGVAATRVAAGLGASVRVVDPTARAASRAEVEAAGGHWVDIGLAALPTSDAYEATVAAVTSQSCGADAVICCAFSGRGRPAAVLLTDEALRGMRAGGVVVDLAAAAGGNAAASEPDAVVVREGITVIGITDAPCRVAAHASALWGACTVRFLLRFVTHDRKFCIDTADPIVRSALCRLQSTEGFHPRTPRPRRFLLRVRPPPPPQKSPADDPDGLDSGWGTLLRLASPEWAAISLGCFGVLVRVPFTLLSPHFASATIGALFKKKRALAVFNVKMLVAVGVVDLVLGNANKYVFLYVQQRFIRRIRLSLFANLLRQETAFFDATPSGALASRLEADIVEMAQDMTWLFSSALEAPCRLVFLVGYMTYMSPQLACVAFAATPIALTVNQLYALWVHRNAREVQSSLAAANHVAMEVLGGASTVTAMGGERYEQRRYAKLTGDVYGGLMERAAFYSWRNGVIDLSFLAQNAGVLVYGMILCTRASHPLDPQVLIAFVMYQGMFRDSAWDVFSICASMERSTGAGRRVFNLLERGSAFPPCPAAVAPLAPKGHVSLEGVCFSYPGCLDAAVLRSVSFEALPGQLVAIVGTSGAGKSTVAHLIKRRYDVDAGTVAIDGVSVRELCSAWNTRHVALVDQEPDLFTGSIARNILYPALCADEGLEERLERDPALSEEWHRRVVCAAEAADAAGFIDGLPLGYDTEVGERGLNLSGGQKQRVALARALLMDPLVLLLDEATSALDVDSERRVVDSLLKQRSRRTTLLVAQRIRAVRDADRIVVMSAGEVLESGTHQELSERPRREDGRMGYRELLEVG